IALAMNARDLFACRFRRRVMKQIAVDASGNQPIADRREPIRTFGMVRAHFVQQARWMRQIGGWHLKTPTLAAGLANAAAALPQRGSNSRLGAALRRETSTPTLAPSALRCAQRGSNSRLGAALRRSCWPDAPLLPLNGLYRQ